MSQTIKCPTCKGTGQAPISHIFHSVLQLFRVKHEYDSAYVASELDIGHDNACKRLNQLVRFGLIRRTGSRCNYRYSRKETK